MTLSPEQMTALAVEAKKLVDDPSYRSTVLYLLVDHMAWQLMHVYAYSHLTMDLKEDMVLAAMVATYQKLPRYDSERAQAARAERGYKPDEARAVYRYVELIIRSAFLRCLSSSLRKALKTCELDCIDSGAEQSDGWAIAAPYEDIDARIDADAHAEWLKALNARIDLIEDKLAKSKTRRNKNVR